MRLGLDIHGVIDKRPEDLAFLAASVINAGGEVHILTGGSVTEEMMSKVRNFGVAWTHFFSVYDHMESLGEEQVGLIKFPDGAVQKKFDPVKWDAVKADYCRRNSIDLHIDDTETYGVHFTTPFMLFSANDGSEKISHVEILKCLCH
jgi:hypothetical protein